jgi:hypothetical protein
MNDLKRYYSETIVEHPEGCLCLFVDAEAKVRELEAEARANEQEIYIALTECNAATKLAKQRAEAAEAEVVRLKGLRLYERDTGDPVHPDSTITVPVGIHMELIERAEAAETKVARANTLVEAWRNESMQAVPPEYANRGMHHKYLKGDNYAGGLSDCADYLEAALQEPQESSNIPPRVV